MLSFLFGSIKSFIFIQTVFAILMFPPFLKPDSATPPVEEYHVRSTNEKIISDARFSESVWGNALPVRAELSPGDFVELRIARNQDYLAFAIWVMDTDVRNDHWDENAKGVTWVDDSVEIYLDCLGDGGDKPRIDDFQIHFDTTPKYDVWGMPDNIWTEQGNGNEWQPVYKPEWHEFMPKIRRSFALLGGKPNDPSDKDEGYIWEVLVPWEILPVKPHATQNLMMGWSVIVRDRDSDGDKTDYMGVIPTGALAHSPKTWGRLIIPPLSNRNQSGVRDASAFSVPPSNDPAIKNLANQGWTNLSPELSQTWNPPSGRPSILYVRSKNASICDMMDQRTLSDPGLREALSFYQLYALDIAGYFQDHPLVKKHGVIRVPTFILFDERGNPIRQINGFQEKSEFLIFLGR